MVCQLDWLPGLSQAQQICHYRPSPDRVFINWLIEADKQIFNLIQ